MITGDDEYPGLAYDNEASSSRHADEEPLVFEMGTIGWDDTPDIFDQGESSNDGKTYVRVQLFRGRDLKFGPPSDAPVQEGVAQGLKVLCTVAAIGGVYTVPPKGTPVMVGFPGAYARNPGHGVLIGRTDTSPPNQFSATRSKMDFGPDFDLVMKARSITLTDYANRFVCIGPDTGVMVQDSDGSGVIITKQTICIFVQDSGDAKTVLQFTKSELSAVQKTPTASMWKLSGGDIQSFGQHNFVQGGVFLGQVPTVTTGVVYLTPLAALIAAACSAAGTAFPTGAAGFAAFASTFASGAAGIASTSVFTSP